MSATKVGCDIIWAWREEMGDVHTGEWSPKGDRHAPMEAEEYVRIDSAVLAELPEVKALVAVVLKRAAREADLRYANCEVGNPGHHILALIDTDHAAALEAVKARDEAIDRLMVVLDRNDTKGPISDVEMMFCWLAAQDVRAAIRAGKVPDTDGPISLLCECGMNGPCMWEKCKSPIRAGKVQPATDYEVKLAQLKKDFPNGI